MSEIPIEYESGINGSHTDMLTAWYVCIPTTRDGFIASAANDLNCFGQLRSVVAVLSARRRAGNANPGPPGTKTGSSSLHVSIPASDVSHSTFGSYRISNIFCLEVAITPSLALDTCLVTPKYRELKAFIESIFMRYARVNPVTYSPVDPADNPVINLARAAVAALMDNTVSNSAIRSVITVVTDTLKRENEDRTTLLHGFTETCDTETMRAVAQTVTRYGPVFEIAVCNGDDSYYKFHPNLMKRSTD
jgi:hypothetical protein